MRASLFPVCVCVCVSVHALSVCDVYITTSGVPLKLNSHDLALVCTEESYPPSDRDNESKKGIMCGKFSSRALKEIARQSQRRSRL